MPVMNPENTPRHTQRRLRVGIMTAEKVEIDFGGGYTGAEGRRSFTAEDVREPAAFRAA